MPAPGWGRGLLDEGLPLIGLDLLLGSRGLSFLLIGPGLFLLLGSLDFGLLWSQPEAGWAPHTQYQRE